MATSIVHDDRVVRLDDGRDPDPDGGHVLYWMQRAQRAQHNDALEHAVRLANAHDVGLHVVFGLTPEYPQASSRHFRFLLQGLAETGRTLARRGIPFGVRRGHPPQVAADAAHGAVAVVVDRAYQRHLVGWRAELVGEVACPVWQVEADVVVPVDVASDDREYAARTIRGALLDRLDEYAVDLDTTPLQRTGEPLPGLELTDTEVLLADLDLDDGMAPGILTGGTAQGLAHLGGFLDEGLGGYGERDPDPVAPSVSYLSAYLHYGQVSPVEALLRTRDADGADQDRGAFVEELVTRRELAVNYVRFTDDYDAFSALPQWARTTLTEHADDEREHVYTAAEMEQGRTHDRAWNACMAQIREEGYLHNHLRMYWGKQVVRWTNTPQYAFRVLLDLNNRYFLDGRDCSSYANVAWVFGLHDRPYGEREVTGKIRPMTRSGLERKLDVDAYVAMVEDRLGPLRGE